VSVQRLATAVVVMIVAFVMYAIAPVAEFWSALASWWRNRR
jgi:hypothetical protein